jgi:hypothetical protein
MFVEFYDSHLEFEREKNLYVSRRVWCVYIDERNGLET